MSITHHVRTPVALPHTSMEPAPARHAADATPPQGQVEQGPMRVAHDGVGWRRLIWRWGSPRQSTAVGGYLAALAIEGGTVLLTLVLVSAVPGFSLLGAWELVAVALIATRWGLGPSLVAALEGALLLEYVVLPPHFGWKAGDASQWPEVASFLLAGLVLSLVITALTRRYRVAVEAEALASARAAAARESTARMDEFVSLATHEMRNPLAYTLATMQLIERKLRKLSSSVARGENGQNGQAGDRDEDMERRLAEIRDLLWRGQRHVHVQDRLIGDLLDASRLRASTFALRPQPCDLRAIVRDVVEEQRGAWPHRTITLDLGDQGDQGDGNDSATLPIHADEQRIAQVLANFLTNAMKYSPRWTPVAVRVECGASADAPVRVLVRDAGPGLPPEERDRVWERFHRVAGVQPCDGDGGSLGLGLHISRSIIERHDGQVGVESQPGQGSTFWFALPTGHAEGDTDHG